MAAVVTLRIKHVDLDEKCVTQNPREVATKFGKHIDSYFHKGFPEAEAVLARWITYLTEVALYGPDDPLFPATAISTNGTDGFKATGFERRFWTTTEPVRKIVNAAFKEAGLEPYGPHSFRHMHSRHISRTCKNVAELVAAFQNLGHSDPLMTLKHYGQISREEQRRLITGQEREEDEY